MYADVLALYRAHREGRAPRLREPRPYRDYIAWQQRQDLASAEAFWRGELDGFAAATPLGMARPTPSADTGDGSRRTSLGEEHVAALQETARRLGVTPNTVVQGAWALLLSRYCGEADVVFGATVSGRPAELEGVEQMVGNFINTLPVRAFADPGAPIAELLAGLQEKQGRVRHYPGRGGIGLPAVRIQSDMKRGEPAPAPPRRSTVSEEPAHAYPPPPAHRRG